jgi:hypothetical protein
METVKQARRLQHKVPTLHGTAGQLGIGSGLSAEHEAELELCHQARLATLRSLSQIGAAHEADCAVLAVGRPLPLEG